MFQRDPWRVSALLGSGALALAVLAAVPALLDASKESSPSPRGARPVVASERWFGQVVTLSAGEHRCFEIRALGGQLVPASELSITRLSDGVLRVIGLLVERADPDARWLLDAELAGTIPPGKQRERAVRDAEEELEVELGRELDDTIDCGDWAYFERIEGTLRGLATRTGASLRLSSARGATAQLGSGANGGDAGPGLRGGFSLEVVEQPTCGAPLPQAPSRGDFRLELANETVATALGPLSTLAEKGPRACALRLAGLGEFRFVAGGQFVESGSGRAKLTGVLERVDDPSATIAVDFTFEGPVSPGESAFPTSVEVVPADFSAWHYYRTLRGELTGFGSLRGARLEVSLLSGPMQVGLGANGTRGEYGASCWIVADVVESPTEGVPLPERIESGELRFGLALGGASCVDAAEISEVSLRADDGSIRLPGFGSDFVFAAGGDLAEHPDGTARLTGVIQRRDAPAYRFLVDLEFAGRIDAGDGGCPPENNPWRDLEETAYVEHGGPIDPDAWHYYTSARGVLRGQGALVGARLEIERDGPAWQVGLGANGRNLAYGFSGWFTGVLRRQPDEGVLLPPNLAGGRLHLDLGGTRVQGIAGASGSSALELGGLGRDFVFVSGGQLRQHEDGTARLNGVVARAAFPLQRFFLDLRLEHRIDPGAAGYPPPGSPKRALSGAAYAEVGGPVDSDSWSYYRGLTGTLTGLERFAGGVLAVHGTGPAFQLGPGANNVNTGPGAGAWLRVEILEQPAGDPRFPATLERGRLHLDLFTAPTRE